jgi:signal transduction histidine kinase
MVREKALKHQLKLAVDLDGVPESLPADERKIKQVLYNLLSNAVKFTPAGGEIRLGAVLQDAAHLSGCPIRTEKHRHWLSVWVADTGIGIEPQDLARVFHPFEQVESSLSRKFQGTGLGLALTRQMVELHSGAIWVESAGANQGSTFRFAIPVDPAREPGRGRLTGADVNVGDGFVR